MGRDWKGRRRKDDRLSTVSRNGARLKVANKAIDKLKDRVRELTRRTRGTSIGAIVAEPRQTLLGWKAYFGIAEVLSPLRDIDKWVRRKLRCYLWKQWGPAGYRELRKRGVSVREAWNTSKSAHGPWRLSKTPALAIALPLRFFINLALPNLAPPPNSIHRTAGYVTRTSGGVGRRGREASSYPDWASQSQGSSGDKRHTAV